MMANGITLDRQTVDCFFEYDLLNHFQYGLSSEAMVNLAGDRFSKLSVWYYHFRIELTLLVEFVCVRIWL